MRWRTTSSPTPAAATSRRSSSASRSDLLARPWFGSYVYELTRKCGDIDVYVISGESDGRPSHWTARPTPRRRKLLTWAAFAVVALCTAIGLADGPASSGDRAREHRDGLSARGGSPFRYRFGRGPSILASVLGVAAFDFFFIPPQWTFAVTDTQYLFTFAVMLDHGFDHQHAHLAGHFQAEAARAAANNETRALRLPAGSRPHSSAGAPSPKRPPGMRPAPSMQRCSCCCATARASCSCRGADPDTASFPERDQGVAAWVFDHGETAGLGTTTLPGAAALYLPIQSAQETVGVLGRSAQRLMPRPSTLPSCICWKPLPGLTAARRRTG